MTHAALPDSRRGVSPATLTALAAIGGLTALAWAVLVAEAVSRGGGGEAFMQSLCRPVGLERGGTVRDALSALPLNLAMWAAMAVGMMLPTAVPMVLAAADRLQDRSRPRPTATLAALLAGYLGVWIVVALIAATVQAFAAAAIGSLALPPRVGELVAGFLLGLAGLYQFSPAKDAGLAFCRHPLRGLGDGGAAGVAAGWREGLAQGAACLTCCAGIMLAMAVAGLMNLFWMAGLCVLMTAEKFVARQWLSRAIGGVLLLGGVALSVSTVGVETVARWLLS